MEGRALRNFRRTARLRNASRLPTALACALRWGLVVASLLLSGCGVDGELPDDLKFLNVAELRVGAGEWRRVEGPLLMAPADYAAGSTAVIRYRLPSSEALPSDLGLYLWRYSMNVAVRVNGTQVHDGGRLSPPLRMLHRPVLIPLLPALLQPGQNQIEVDLGFIPGYGYLLPPLLGPLPLLSASHERRYFVQVTLSQITFALSLLLMLLAAVLLLSDRGNRAYLYFGLAALGWAIYSLNPFLADPPMGQRGWLVVLHTGVDLISVSLTLFVLGYFQLLQRWHEWLALGFGSLAVAVYLQAPLLHFAQVSSVVHLVSLALVALAVSVTAFMALRRGRRDGYAFTAAFAMLFGLGLHDLLLNAGGLELLWRRSFFSLNLGAPLFLSALAVQLLWQLRRANRYAEQQLAQTQRALEHSFAEQRTLAQRAAAAAERTRIYQDLHDDVGARLLDLVYAAQTPEQKALARSALSEVRALSSLERNLPGTLAALSLQVESEVRQRLESQNIALHWSGASADLPVSPAVAHQAVRVIREWTTNTLKHASAARVAAGLALQEDMLAIRFEDDGVGFADDAEGNGLTNASRRVASLGGTLRRTGSPGTGWEARLPLETPPGPQAP